MIEKSVENGSVAVFYSELGVKGLVVTIVNTRNPV